MDPYPAPLLLRESMWMLPYAQGKIDDLHLTDIDSIVQRCNKMRTSDPIKGADECEKIISYISDVSGGSYSYDTRFYEQSFNDGSKFYQTYLDNTNL